MPVRIHIVGYPFSVFSLLQTPVSDICFTGGLPGWQGCTTRRSIIKSVRNPALPAEYTRVYPSTFCIIISVPETLNRLRLSDFFLTAVRHLLINLPDRIPNPEIRSFCGLPVLHRTQNCFPAGRSILNQEMHGFCPHIPSTGPAVRRHAISQHRL